MYLNNKSLSLRQNKLNVLTMKKLLFLGAMAVMALSCSTQKEEIAVKLDNLADQKVVVRYSDLINEDIKTVTDTIQAVAGAFNIDLPDTSAYVVSFYPESSVSGRRVAQQGVVTVYVKPGEKIQIKGNVDGKTINYTAKGSLIATDFAVLRASYLDNQKQMEDIYLMIDSLSAVNADRELFKPIQESAEAISNAIKEIKVNFVKSNTANELSGIIVASLPSEEFYDLHPQLAANVVSGISKVSLEKTQKRYDRSKAIEAAKALIVEGNPAPDFTLTDINGNPLSLSSLRGKYVVLDFWGKWCIWCVRGIPEMKTTYDKVKSKFEFLGIDHGDTEEVWKSAVAEYQLPWLNVYNGKEENDITVRYGISGFPTKIIVDPKGNIAYVSVGESPEFYAKVMELYKKR